ncbi:hypothetical protein LJC14_06070, partial [Treponema sp. OttesenSCG-928-L16]|nr:hypothetical protein [Treponema sp. OttesenSCG-928-L16]
MLTNMTLSKRNLFFKIGIAFAALSLVLAAASISLTSSAYAPLMQESAGRSRGILQFILTRFVEPHAYVPYVSMLISSLYSCITIIIVYYFFEKTQAPEILFFFLFVLSFSFEGARSMLPLVRSLNMPNLYAIIATRILIFSRYFGLLS